MKSFAALVLGLLVSAQAFAANPKASDLPMILATSPILKAIKLGVAKTYHVPHCDKFRVSSYNEKEAEVQAETYCTYTDSTGEGSGVWIQIKGVFYDSDLFILKNAKFELAG